MTEKSNFYGGRGWGCLKRGIGQFKGGLARKGGEVFEGVDTPMYYTQTLSKALDISCATAWSDILSDTTVRRSAVDREDLKPYWKSQKSSISLHDQQSYYLHVFQRLY